MITSKKLTNERLMEIKAFPITYTKDAPKLTSEKIAMMKARHSEFWKIEPVKVSVSIKIDADVLSWYKSMGKGYQTRINKALREAMMRNCV